MQLSINVHHLELTTRLQDYVEKKTGRLDRYMPNLVETKVDLSEQNAKNAEERQVAQITIRDRHGTILRAEERSSDIFTAVDAVVDKLYRQINRYRGKVKRRHRRNGRMESEELLMAEPLPIEEVYEDEEDFKVVRRKEFSTMPMTVEEAADQMDLLGHDFFVFFNNEEESINVIYRRRDNSYGLLLPGID
ncbi:MAG: ribosome-associated translation inhibitor RaiA [Anaerolineales bacterium]|nr:ribosome-associated translation inhibitor RaiA [Anaerolineales bacterium]